GIAPVEVPSCAVLGYPLPMRRDGVCPRSCLREGGAYPRWALESEGLIPAIYLCDSPETALAEFLARSRRMRLPDSRLLPMVMAAIQAKVSRALDLDKPRVAAVVQPLLASEKIHWRAIQNRREAISQAMGRAFHELGLHVLLTTSQARPAGR